MSEVSDAVIIVSDIVGDRPYAYNFQLVSSQQLDLAFNPGVMLRDLVILLRGTVDATVSDGQRRGGPTLALVWVQPIHPPVVDVEPGNADWPL